MLGYPTHVLTDHQALTFLFQCQMRNARLTRWILLLQEFDLCIKYIPGSENVIDSIPRNSIGRDDPSSYLNTHVILAFANKVVFVAHHHHLSLFRSIISTRQQEIHLLKFIKIVVTSPSPISVKL